MTQSQPGGFLAEPKAGMGRGVLVLHAWWGLNDTMKDVCTRLADEGFVAFAPDLFHGEIATTVEEAEKLAQSHDGARTTADIVDAVRFLGEHSAVDSPQLAVMGFSFGAYYALEHSMDDPVHIRSVVVFYGTNPRDYKGSKAEYLGHFAENDPFEPMDMVDTLEESLRKAGRPTTFHRYPGTGHWFFEPDRADAYDIAAANLAWERTLEFLKETL